ncbi:VanW family protein [Nocardioides sp. KIGAM211]|uniref:VanW family protein n=1 Tax=Nocardioides luti TaxID=2761101 RepID=A0A7X0REQ3_9ACTN|nr:VanW family protein [Nocardioides luti]MBB6626917.1 VanW family protein [Nocardioides luti]
MTRKTGRDQPTPPQGREKEGGWVVLGLLLGLALLLGGGYAAAYVLSGDKVPRGASVAGVAIGGRTPEAAAQVLAEGLAERSSRPIDVTVGGTSVSVTPAQAGLAVDYAASVAAAGGEQSWDPQRLWDYYTGGDDLDPVLTVDEDRLDAAVQSLAAGIGRPATDASLRFEGARIVTTKARTGRALDLDAARTALQAAYLSDEPRVDLPLSAQAPDVDDADLQEALDDFANPALSAPVTLVFGDSRVRLQPRDYADALGMEAQDGELVPVLDEKALEKLVDGAVSDNGAPVDASVALVDGKPRVVPAKPGVAYDPADVSDAFLTLVTRPDGKREMTVKASVAEPDFTTKDARALKVRERVSTFTTYYPYAEYRNTNIGRAAELVDGTLLKPGETFSLNDTVGERTRENGFTEGFIISDGIFKEDLGGGVSQMATTTFNAMFFAGLEDVEHKPHSFYIDRYPVGREATVAWGAVDLRFRNDTPYGVLVHAQVTPSTPSSQGVVTVSMYSTKVWDITTSTSDRYDLTEPATRVLRTPDCYPNTGYGGFDVDVTRYFRKAGESALDHDEVFHTTYTPSDTVICKPPRG